MNRAVVALALGLVGLGCSSGGDDVVRPEPCDLSEVAIVPGPSVSQRPDATDVARVSSFSPMSERGPVDLVVVRGDGRIEALGGDPRAEEVRHAALDGPALAQLVDCVDESGFLELPEGSHSPAQGGSGGRLCVVSDAATVTVTARGSSGGARTAAADGLGLPGSSCSFDHPEPLVVLYGALDQLRDRIAAVGAPVTVTTAA